MLRRRRQAHLLLAVQPASAAGHRLCSPQIPARAAWFGSIRALYYAQRSAAASRLTER
jgi:hypothetical protein